jgi:hypothetical protein
MNAEFLNAWKVYRRGVKRPAFAGEAPRGEAAFDLDVKVGEIRIFADGNQPLTALVVADCGLSGRRIVPVSPFASPASDREMLVGERVFQLWNTTRASRRFTDRSWRVDALSAEDLVRVQQAIAASAPGRITAGDGPQARYEREFLISSGNFIPFAEPRAARRDLRHYLFSGWGMAASLVFIGSAFAVLCGGGIRRGASSVWQEVGIRLHPDAEFKTIELVECEPAESDAAEFAREMIARENAPRNSIPQMPQPRAIVSGPVPTRPPRYDGGGIGFDAATLAAGFARADRAPCALLTAGGRGSAEKGGNRPFAYAASGALPTIAEAGAVACVVTECPWNTSHRLLNIRAASAKGLVLEIGFDAKAVSGYRLLSNAGGEAINAYYEIVPAGLSGLPEEAVTVTTRWYDAQGARQRAECVRTGRAADLDGLPQLPRRASGATGAVSPDDVPVKVDF